ncbi:ACP S-malonyltransferase [Trinickia sp. NRRL B-1857]|uniref:ACP S-malonyltransferase n=1 Tax=Trinickia sp. NRRL B-1857 TaxID=3162879 RepID=UPI003D2794B1
MKVFVFPGQGSQLRGMGGTLFDDFPDLTRQASEILGYSIKELCLEDPRKELNQTQFTQPAIYVVNALSYFRRMQTGGQAPAIFAGHSLGEFNALMAAGCFDFELGLRLVKVRGELMGRVSGSGMAAVMNIGQDRIAAIIGEEGAQGVDIAIHNSPTQSIIAGLREDLERLASPIERAGGMFYPLNTSGAFHSRYMRPIAEDFRGHLMNAIFSPLKKSVIANVSARPYGDDEVVANLVNQLTRPVLWCESVQYLLAQGATDFEEIGDSDVLTKLIARIKATPLAPPQGLPVASDTTVQPRAASAREDAHIPPRSPADKVAAWNQTYPIGTRVRSARTVEGELETRTSALVLFGHRAAVYLKGYNGYFDLDELQIV